MLLTKYIIKNLIIVTIFSAITLTAIIWLTQSLKFLELIVNSDAPIGLFMQLVVLSLPKFLEVILPISLMISVVFLYNKMISDNEMIVMRACGVNQLELSKPAIILACIVTIILLFLGSVISPLSQTKLKAMVNIAKAEYSTVLLREGIFNNIGKDITVYIQKKSSNGEMSGIMIHDNRDKSSPPSTILAKKGLIILEEGIAPQVVVYQGTRQTFDKETKTMSRLDFSQYTIEFPNFNKISNKNWKDTSERNLIELFNPDNSKQYDRDNKSAFLAEAHRRITLPFYALAFTLISLACLLTGSFNRRGHSRKIFNAVTLVVLLQGLSLAVSSLAKKHELAIILMYLLAILPIVISVYLLTDKGGIFLRNLNSKRGVA